MLDLFKALSKTFGQEGVCCMNCRNWQLLGTSYGRMACLGTCREGCFDFDAPGGRMNTILLSPSAHCFCESAKKQAFDPNDLLLSKVRDDMDRRKKEMGKFLSSFR